MTEPNTHRADLAELGDTIAEITAEWEAADAACAVTAALATRIWDAAERTRDLLYSLTVPDDLRESVRATDFYMAKLLDDYRDFVEYNGVRDLYRQLIHAHTLATTVLNPAEHPSTRELTDRIHTALTYLYDNEDGSYTDTVITILRGEHTN